MLLENLGAIFSQYLDIPVNLSLVQQSEKLASETGLTGEDGAFIHGDEVVCRDSEVRKGSSSGSPGSASCLAQA